MAKMATESRNLVFSDGSSNKFWKIELEGSSHTVTFGKIGTSGQSQTKDFESSETAKKSYDKLVAEKTKKGYVDADGAPVASSSVFKVVVKESAKPNTKPSATAEPTIAKSPKAQSHPTSAVVESKGKDHVGTDRAASASLAVNLNIERAIDLTDRDWFRASFRKRAPLDRGVPSEFNKEQSLGKIAKLKTTTYGWDTRWEDLSLAPALSKEEAAFWLVAMTEPRGRDVTMKSHAESLSKKKISPEMNLGEIRKHLEKVTRGIPELSILCIWNLVDLDDLIELLLEKPKSSVQNAWQGVRDMKSLMDGFVRLVLPYLSETDLASIRSRIRKNWDSKLVPTSSYDSFPPEYYMAAAIGMHDEVYEATSSWEPSLFKDEWADHYSRPQDIVFGLGSAEMVAYEWRRLHLRMKGGDDVRAFLACTDYTALDCIADSIIQQSNKEQCEEQLKVLALVRAPEAAEPMLRCKLEAKTPSMARDWLDQHVGCAVFGLIETAGGKGKLADAAIDYLRGVKKKGQGAVIAAALKELGKSAATARVQADVLDHEEKVYEPHDEKSTPAWLSAAIAESSSVKRKSLPAWASPAVLPPLIVGERRLNDQQTEVVLQLLVTTPLSTKQPLLVALREHLSKVVRDEFAWKLFQFWQEDGFSAKEKWAMGAIGHLGDDGCVLKLTPMIRVWPGESQHARAVFGLECLRAIGSSSALMNLSGIAQKLKFKALKSKAEQFVTEIATERGLTRDELEDRVVPDCGLDEKGRREFSFGPRSFSFVLSGDLKAAVRDESGKIRGDLPAANAKDDEATAKESIAEWKLMKKQIKEVATIQAGRLEQSMVTGRRWNTGDFEELLVRHPLMTHLVQKAIWAGYDEKKKRTTTFRITEERDYASSDDESVSLAGVTSVGLVHPLELSDAERSRWGEVLSDYEIVSPFPQLGRAIYSLEKGEENKDSIERFHGLKLVAPTLVFTLEKLGWTRGVAMDGGCFTEHSKQFPAANVTAVVNYEGTVAMGYIDPNEILTLESICFCSGMRSPSGYGWDKSDKKLKLAEVPPVVCSEVVADLQVLKSKAK